MPVQWTCPNTACSRASRVPDAARGKRVTCPGCGRPFVVGESATAAAPSTDDGGHPPPATPVTDPPLEAVGRFVLRAKLGEGGFGAVYRAYDPHLDREVALKVPHAAVLDSPKRVERFLREAKAAANLRHPHIVPVFDTGSDGGRHYIASAFINGQKLADAVEASDGGLDIDRAARLVRELAEALAYAHEQGVVHRDVKPDNVMLDAHDRVHLIDFGLAVKQDAESRPTSDGAVMGTPSYMAPEQAKGDTANVGPAADQYACGVVLYELLTGKKPFRGPVPVVLYHHAHTAPPPPRSLRRAAPRDLETVCLMAMNKRPAERYASCRELADDLRRWQEGEPVSVRPLNAGERAGRWVRKNPAGVGLVAAGVLLVGLAAVAVGFAVLGYQSEQARAAAEGAKVEAVQARDEVEQAREGETRERLAAEDARDQLAGEQLRTTDARDEAVRQRQLAEQAKEVAEKAQAAEAEARKQAEREKEKLAVFEYGRTIQVAHGMWEDANIVGMRARLDGTKPELRGWEWRYLNRLCDGSRITLKGHTSNVFSASFSPDGTRVVTAGTDKTVWVWDAKTGELVHTLKGHTSSVFSAAFSPDGALILTVGGDATARVWDAKTGELVHTLKGHARKVLSAAFSPDGTRVLTASVDTTAKVWDAKTGKEVVTLKGHTSWVISAAFSPDGTRVVTAGGGTAVVWDAKTGDVLHVLRGHTAPVYAAAFSRDGTRVVTGSADTTAKVWDVSAPNDGPLTTSGHVRTTGFTPDGAILSLGSGDKTVRVRDARMGKELVTLKGHTGGVTSAGFSPDGTRVVTADGEAAVVWDAKTGETLHTLKGHTSGVTSAAFSPDGTRVVTAGTDRTARVWDAKTGELVTLKGHTNWVLLAAFSPDGTRVVTADSDKTAVVWDAKTGETLHTLKGHMARVESAAFSPAGTRVLTAGDDTARVWDAKTGDVLHVLRGHTATVRSAAFSPDGTRVVTASIDKTAMVWDATTGADVLRLRRSADITRYFSGAVRWSPDGSCVVDEYSGGVRVWDAQPPATPAKEEKK